MKIINLEQGTDEWLQWRRSILTASDASSILDVNPYCDAMELRLRKLGFIPDNECTPAMKRGQEMEPIARDHYHSINKHQNFTPAVVESSEFPFLGASLDGITDDGKCILEIKCGEKSYKMAENVEIPDYYMSQIQHQLICTRAEICYYFCFNGEKGITMEVLPSADFEAHYLPLAEKFWMELIFKPPEIFIKKPKITRIMG